LTWMDDMKSFEALMKDAPVLLDGATGTCLMAAGMPKNGCREMWMLEHEEAVIRLQRAYAAAGSRIIYAPTFTAQPCRLETHGLEDQTEEVNYRLARLSKAAAPDCLIAGSMTTLAGMKLTKEDMIRQYRRQFRGLMTGGVDMVVGETLMSCMDAEAIFCAAKAEGAECVCLSFALLPDGRLRSGEEMKAAFTALERLGASALGVNCVPADHELPVLVEQMKACTSLPLIVKPNAGIPVSDGGALRYTVGTQDFADVMLHCVDTGAKLIGGCCGTTPETMAAVSQRIHYAE